jgi:Flp pilus assembly protein TadD
MMQLRANAADLAFLDLAEAVRRAPADTAALNGFIRAAARGGRLEEAENVLVHAGALVHLSVVRAARGDLDGATRAALEAVIANPRNPDAVRQLASMYADRGDAKALEQLLLLANDRAFDKAIPLYVRARLAYVQSDYAGAIELGGQLARLTPADANVFNMLASAHAALAQHDLARAALETSRRLAPTDPGVLVNMGTIELRAGNPAAAAVRFEEALFLAPTSAQALDGLATAMEQQGNTSRAAALRARAR